MARTMTIKITDAIDGSANADGYSFSFDGQDYTIDLSKKNKAEMDKVMKPYLAAATKAQAPRSSRTAPNQANSRRTDLNEIRDWARANGHQVSDRGRIAASVAQEYDAAH
jgi:hypothetical protein